MKILFNGKELLELNETQKKVIKNDISSQHFEKDMTRRCKYWLESPQDKYSKLNEKKLSDELRSKGRMSVPVDPLKKAKLHSELYPCKCGYSGLDQPIQCQVGDELFVFPPEHRIINRKVNEHRQLELSHEDYEAEEMKLLEDKMVWILKHKYEKCMERLRLEWMPKLLARGIEEAPSDDDAFAELVFAQPDYMDREQRDAEEERLLRENNQ